MPLLPNKQTYPYSPRTHYLRNWLILLVWVGALGFAGLHRQDIRDWWRLQGYQAPAAVADLASQDAMTDYSRKIFYVNRPAIVPKGDFRQDCPASTAEQTIVLGCYHSGQNGIYLLSVDEPRLNGVEQVTAAHEMLHGAYERLSHQERQRVDGLLQAFYKNDLHDQRVLDTIEAYKKTEPDDVVNEMHSIFGTEIVTLPPALEQYYSRYFSNRAQVAAYAALYQSEFTSRQTTVSAYDSQLAALKSQIEALEDQLKNQQEEITSQQRTLLALREANNIAAYNAGVPAYNALISDYNARVGQLRQLINQYNHLVTLRNTVALEENELVKDLSSDVQTINQ